MVEKKEVPFRFETRGVPVDEIIKKLKEKEKERTEKLRELRETVEKIRKEKEEKEKKQKEQITRIIEQNKEIELKILSLERELLTEKRDDWTIKVKLKPAPLIILTHPRKPSIIIPVFDVKKIAKEPNLIYTEQYKHIPEYIKPTILKLIERIKPIL